MTPRSSHTFFDRKHSEAVMLPGQCDEAKTPNVSVVSPNVSHVESESDNTPIVRHVTYRKWCVIL